MSAITPARGRPWPLGATREARGVNFAVFSAHASGAVLCLFDGRGEREAARVRAAARSDDVWHLRLDDAQLRACGVDPTDFAWGWRVEGPHEPQRGHRFNPAKLLIDPYARRFAGEFRWTDTHDDNGEDNAADTLKARLVADDAFDWRADAPPATPLAETVIYEAHVKGLTALHEALPPELRGTYEGLAAEPVIAHLKRIGVTAVSLLPVQQAISERGLVERGLSNYWGYNTIGFFAPDARFATAGGDPVREFRTMVRALHAAGLEVILDVVYNHTPEGDHRGPTLSLRGLDNASYYRLRPGAPSYYENLTGCGNALDLGNPRVLQLVADSLRYWVEEMHVDGFRFDLASALARNSAADGGAFAGRGAFFACLRQDPVLARVKLIAEPWDIGIGGYQLGGFPPGWSEWNDRYRDTVRAFWVRKAAYRGEIAARVAGSSDIFGHGPRGPLASVNYVAAHDGFTLRDLLSYDHKHNESNGEENRDGHEGNHSWNCGVEGPSDLLAVQALRGRLSRSLLATLFVSQGVPMLLAGDELGRTQRGNNNAYCQDNPTSWVDWAAADETLIAFVAHLAQLRRQVPQLRRDRWLRGGATATGQRDIVWLNRQGSEMNRRQWDESGRFAFGFVLGADGAHEAPLLVLINAEASDWTIGLPPGAWRLLVDSGQRDGLPEAGTEALAGSWLMKARSLSVFAGEPGQAAIGERATDDRAIGDAPIPD